MENYFIKKHDFGRNCISEVARIHREQLGEGFLSSLGERSLRMMFSFSEESDEAVLLVAYDHENKAAIGFALGSIDTGRFYKDFLRKKSFEAVLVIGPKLFSFSRIIKVFETLFYPAKKVSSDLPTAELLDIAVVEAHQGRGVAQLLFHQFVEELRDRGVDEFRITTGAELIRAQRFYESLGAKQVCSMEVHKGQTTVVFVYDIIESLCV